MKNYQIDNGFQTEMSYMESLDSDDPGERYQAVRKIRNLLIGMKCKKNIFVKIGLVEKLLDLMVEEQASVEFAVEATVVLGSIARGGSENLKHIFDSHAIPILCKGVCHSDERLVTACLRSLRICFMSNQVPSDLIYEDISIVSKLVNLLTTSSQTAEYSANILQKSCKTTCDQSVLYEANVISALLPWLSHEQCGILVPILALLSAMVYGNEIIANEVLEGEIAGVFLRGELVKLISSDRPDEVQLEAANCLTKAIRVSTTKQCTIKLQRKILNVFVRLCQKDKPYKIKINAANGLAYLIEDDNDLQSMTAISNHLIKNIAAFFNIPDTLPKETKEALKEGAFKVFAALSANEEKVRKQIVESSSKLMDNIHEAINQELNILLQAAALQCVLSLSRSVQQLRTTFQDVKIWQPIITALKSSTSDDVISVSSSVLCNLLLEFSPCKDALVEYGALDVLVALMKRDEIPLKVNGVWGIMNLAYDANDYLKNTIVEIAGIDNILSLVTIDHLDIALKAIGILRNLLTEKEQDIDNLMKAHGKQILASIKPLVIDIQTNEKLKEQVLCLLSNIANGGISKDILMTDEVLIKKVIENITSEKEELQVASVCCITNLMRISEGYDPSERQLKLRDLGAEKQLQTLLTTSNSNLFDRVKQALQQFS